VNFGEAVDVVAYRLGKRTDLDTYIKTEMQLAQKALEAGPLLPWFLIPTDQYTTLVAGEKRLTLPTGFLREYEDGAVWRLDTDCNFHKIEKTHVDVLREVDSDAVEADEKPAYYQLAGSFFHFAPTPEVDTTILLLFYAAAADLSADTDTNVWLDNAPEVLICKTGMRMAQWLRSTELFAMFQAQYVEAMQGLDRANTARYMENFEVNLQMGG
jgi:hypothetical protein